MGAAYWGRGIGTDAASILSNEALASGALRRLEARVFAPNVASARVLEKCGFQLEGRLRAFYVDREDRVCDALAYGRVAALEMQQGKYADQDFKRDEHDDDHF